MKSQPRTVLIFTLVLTVLPLPLASGQDRGSLKLENVQSIKARWRKARSGKSATANAKPDQNQLAELERLHQTEGDWGGTRCPSPGQMRSLVDTFLAIPNPRFPGRGSTIPGVSVSWNLPGCRTFNYAAGLRDIENNQRLTPATPMGIASMTKPVIAALTLKLSEEGAFGPNGLDTTVDQLLSHEQVIALTVGNDLLQPRCPGVTYLRNRDTLHYELASFSCPDFSRISLRDLMRANHGMYDFINEVLLPNRHRQYNDGLYFDIYEFLGFDPLPPVSSRDGFDYLKAYGLKSSNSAIVGGNRVKDFESSFGNTGFQLLGIILESRTGKTLDELIQTMIVGPLGLDPINVYVDPNKRQNLIADGYEIYTDDPVIEQTGIYPLVNLNGHTAVNTRSLGLGHPGNLNLAGGAAGLVANPKSYRAFLDAFANGTLLGPVAKEELDHSYILIPEFSDAFGSILNGFGLVKIQLRGFPGLGDIELYEHNGYLAGVICQNLIVHSTESQRTLATGVICQNSRENAYPDQFDLLLEFLNKVAEAQGEH